MNEIFSYLNHISSIGDETFQELQKLLVPIELKKNDFFVKQGAYAKQIGFLSKGVVRDFFSIMKEKSILNSFL